LLLSFESLISALLAASSKATTPLNFPVFIASSTFFSASKILSLVSSSYL